MAVPAFNGVKKKRAQMGSDDIVFVHPTNLEKSHTYHTHVSVRILTYDTTVFSFMLVTIEHGGINKFFLP